LALLSALTRLLLSALLSRLLTALAGLLTRLLLTAAALLAALTPTTLVLLVRALIVRIHNSLLASPPDATLTGPHTEAACGSTALARARRAGVHP
jgi:hypothetical protein